MIRPIQNLWRKLWASSVLCALSCCPCLLTAHAGSSGSEPPPITNVSGLVNVAPAAGIICAYDLQGTVLAANGDSGTLFFEDNSGVAALEMARKRVDVRPGERIRLRGTNYLARTDKGFSLGTRPLVNADNRHSEIERSGKVHLAAGRHSIRVGWFNWVEKYSLNVEFAGPHLARQAIPPNALFQKGDLPAGDSGLHGLHYHCFEGVWDELPDFDSLVPASFGVVSTFDLRVKTRDENVGLEFSGFLEVPEDGDYTFYLTSDDGSQLFLDDSAPQVDVIGTAQVPVPQPVTPGKPLLAAPDALWAETGGTITFMSRYKNHVEIELSSDGNQMLLEVMNSREGIPWYLLNSTVRVRGICPNIKDASGQRCAAAMVVAGWRDVQVLGMAPAQWSAFGSATIGELKPKNSPGSGGVACLHGRLYVDSSNQTLQFADPTGTVPIDLLDQRPHQAGTNIECLSRWSGDGSHLFLHEAVVRELSESAAITNENTGTPPILATAMQVQRLTRVAAGREYPVEIHGVVTSIEADYKSFVIQDASRGVYVWARDANPQGTMLRLGDYCKIEGFTRPADFSPIVVLRQATVLWQGPMPAPLANMTRDQLLGGSLDAQYVEIRGLVIATSDAYITVLTSEGIIHLDVSPSPGDRWQEFLNSIICVRGCLVANWDPDTHRVVLDQPIHLRSALVSMESPPPSDLFAASTVRAQDLMQFDVHFDTFRRVKVCGQVIHGRSELYYLMDGASGLRFRPFQPMDFDPGDDIEVVGLVELGGASPVLRQAVARKTGHQRLPAPRALSLNFLSNDNDSTLVTMEATLVDLQRHGADQILQLQIGVKNFAARLNSLDTSAPLWEVGSRLKLTGTFSALDGDRLTGQDVNSFELLLNSPADVQVIARPPWWTLSRLLVVVTGLFGGLSLAFVWITLLRRQVDRRTQQLQREIGERERAEKLQAIEHERSRIARDLHDDLGSTLTEISMMATVGPSLNIGSSTAMERLGEIAEKSRSMVSALDGVVWVVNSKNDTLSSLIEYIASYAEEFLGKARIACRIELPKGYADQTIAAEVRHDVMLAIKEIFNNAVRHGRPREVLLRQAIAHHTLEVLIQDDGCGFDPAQAKGNGLANLQVRMAKLNGSCEIHCPPAGGAVVVLKLPLPA